MQINPMDINDAIKLIMTAQTNAASGCQFAFSKLCRVEKYLNQQIEAYFADDTPTTILFAAIGSSNMDSDPTKFFEACGIPVGAA